MFVDAMHEVSPSFVFKIDESVNWLYDYALLGYYTMQCTKSLKSLFRLSLNVACE
jgi:hypothetical protein